VEIQAMNTTNTNSLFGPTVTLTGLTHSPTRQGSAHPTPGQGSRAFGGATQRTAQPWVRADGAPSARTIAPASPIALAGGRVPAAQPGR
jgi:hypothetical protein